MFKKKENCIKKKLNQKIKKLNPIELRMLLNVKELKKKQKKLIKKFQKYNKIYNQSLKLKYKN